MSKTAVYSWRLAPDLKMDLEDAARRNQESVAQLLERIARDWLSSARHPDKDAEQRRLHARAAQFIGALQGDGEERSTRVRALVREKLARRHERSG